jgi:hypothetical protein
MIRTHISVGARRHASDRIRELDREWDIDRAVQAHVAAVGLAGVLLGRFVDRRFRFLSAVAALGGLSYAVFGWYPPLAVLRRLGFRKQHEIEVERRALLQAR